MGQEEYFVAGLLHDLGKLPLQSQFPEAYYRICGNVNSGQSALFQNEARFLGIDHGTVGSIIAEKWRLGPTFVESLSYHHSPGDASDKNMEFVSTVELANQLSLQLNIGNAGDNFVDHSKVTLLMGELGVDRELITDIQSTVPGEIERAKIFLEVAQNG